MITARLRPLIAQHFAAWSVVGILLSALQPFLFIHFRHDGWEDEPGFRVRNVASMALFEPDDRADHGKELETTLYAPMGAHTDSPEAFELGIDTLMALVGLLLPLTLVLVQWVGAGEGERRRRPAFTSGAPPPAFIRRHRPPANAPPLTT